MFLELYWVEISYFKWKIIPLLHGSPPEATDKQFMTRSLSLSGFQELMICKSGLDLVLQVEEVVKILRLTWPEWRTLCTRTTAAGH